MKNININTIFRTLDTITNKDHTNKDHAKGNLFPVIDLENNAIKTTDSRGKASRLEDVGGFFIKIIHELDLSSEKINFLSQSFTAIKESKRIDNNLEFLKSLHKKSHLPFQPNDDYRKLRKEDLAYNIFNMRFEQMLWQVGEQEKKALDTLIRLFPEDKLFILQKFYNETKLTPKDLATNIRKMSKAEIERVNKLIVEANTDLKLPNKNIDRPCLSYRRLKQRLLLGGVRFSKTVTEKVYKVFESPEETATQIQNDTKTNFAEKSGVGILEKPNIDSLINGTYPLNETTLSVALMTEITNKSNEYISRIVNIFENFNEAVENINWEISCSLNEQSKEINEIESAKKIIDYTSLVKAECKNIMLSLNDIQWKGIEELKEKWNEHYGILLSTKYHNKKILNEISNNKTKILKPFKTLKEFPAKELLELKDRNIAIIDELLRETIFETTKMVRMKKTIHFSARPSMHKKIIEKLKIIQEKSLKDKLLEEKALLEEELLEDKASLEEKLLEEKASLEELASLMKELVEKNLKQDLPELVLLESFLTHFLKKDQKSIAIIDEHFNRAFLHNSTPSSPRTLRRD